MSTPSDEAGADVSVDSNWMNDFLVDTDILIDHLRGQPEARGLLEGAIEEGVRAYCSSITKVEIYAGIRTGEEEETQALFEILESIGVDDRIALLAGRYLNQFAKSHGLEIGDAIIAATTKVMGVCLYTRNRRHYPMDDIEVMAPYTF